MRSLREAEAQFREAVQREQSELMTAGLGRAEVRDRLWWMIHTLAWKRVDFDDGWYDGRRYGTGIILARNGTK